MERQGHIVTNPPPPAAILLDMCRRMVLLRRFEDRLYQLFLQGLVPGTLHQYQGQEGVAVGVCSALRAGDLIFSTHRPAGHAIAKGMSLGAIATGLRGRAAGCAGGSAGPSTKPGPGPLGTEPLRTNAGPAPTLRDDRKREDIHSPDTI